MEQIENVQPFPLSGWKGGDAERLSEPDRTTTFSALLSADMSGLQIALAVFASNFVKMQQERPLHQTRLIRLQAATARQLFDLEDN